MSLSPFQGPVRASVFSSPLLKVFNGGKEEPQTCPFALCFQHLAGLEKSGLGTPNHIQT